MKCATSSRVGRQCLFHLLVFTLAVLCVSSMAQVARDPSSGVNPAAKSTAVSPQRDTAELVFARTAPAVVLLLTRKSGNLYSSASGIILSADGYIATNYHALQGADAVEIRFFPAPSDSEDYQSFNRAKLLYLDAEGDIAILKVNANSLPFLEWPANVGREGRVGEAIYAIGNPEGLTNTISEGIVSALRSVENEDIIQHTAPISHGSSGGALVDSTGSLLGMNSWQLTDGQNLNFAISAKHIVAALEAARQNVTALSFPSEKRPTPPDKQPDASPKPEGAWSMPNDWINTGIPPNQTQDVKVRVTDQHVYMQWTVSNGWLTRKETCDTTKVGNEWVGRCLLAFTIAPIAYTGYKEASVCTGIEQQMRITLLTEERIEGTMEYLEFPPFKKFPKQCPVLHKGEWKGTGAFIPKL